MAEKAMTGGPNHAKLITGEFCMQVSGLIEQILAEMKKLRELGYSSPTLSLTLASIDRIADMQRQLYECMEQVDPIDIVPVRRDLVPEQELIESMVCAGLYGGTRSLQHIMARVLNRVLKIVQKEANTSFFSFRELRRWSRTLLAISAGGLALWKNREQHVVHMAGAVTVAAFSYDVTHRRSRAIKALKQAEEELATLTQLWTLMLAFGTLHRKMNKDQAQAFLDRSEWLEILSRRLVEDLPPSNKISLWYNHFAGGKLLRKLVTCWYASVGTASSILPEFLWKSLGPMLSVMCFPVYLCMPSAATEVARVHTSSCEIGYVGKVWSTIEMQWAKPLICHTYNMFTNVKVQQVIVGGQDCLLLSPRRHPGRDIDMVLFLHGGGYIAHIWLADMLHAVHWVQSLGVCVMIPSYPLLPEWPFPEAILRTCDVYECIYVSLPAICGLTARKTIIVGESAGANLAASVCINLVAKVVSSAGPSSKKNLDVTYCDYGALSVQHGVPSSVDPNRTKSCVDLHVMVDEAKVPIPAAVVMVYPPLNMDFHPSMSRVLNVGDPLLPLGVLLALGRSYDIQHGSGVADYLKQPLLTPPSILRKFPPTFFMVGGYDPFLDDSVNWHMRIAAAGAPTRLHIYPDLSHGFLSFSKLVPAAKPALRDLDRYLAEQFQRA